MLVEAKTDCTVCGEAATCGEAMEILEKQSPELAILDISLGAENGIDLAKEVLVSFPDLKILIHSFYDEDAYAGLAYQVGARGFVSKGRAPTHLVDAINTVLAGELFFSSSVLNDTSAGNFP